MIDIHHLHKEIAKILRLRTNLSYPIGIQGQDNPSFDNWISFRLTNWKQMGDQGEEYVDEDLNSIDYKTESHWRVTLNIVTVGLLSDQLAVQLSHQLNKTFYLDSFEAIGLFYLNKSEIRHTPYKLASGWEQRHQFDVNFNILVSDTDELDFIDKIEITHEVIGETGDVIYTDTEEIDI